MDDKQAAIPVKVFLGKDREVSTRENDLRDSLSTEELELLRAIQDWLLTEIDERGIVIEACPTSNLYIARLHSHEEHPLFRWRPPCPELLIPGEGHNRFGLRKGPVAVCLNTDDPAIFPTNIATEHFLMTEAAIRGHGVSRAMAEDWIDRIRRIGVDLFRRTNRRASLMAP